MTSTVTDRGIFVAAVSRRRDLCQEHFEVTLSVPSFPPAAPGQFVQVLCRDPVISAGEVESLAPILRRPFSIGGVRRNSQGAELDLLGRVIGFGTSWLSARRPGDCVDILGPLGRGFTLAEPGEIAIVVAGGIGLPPIRWLAAILREKTADCRAIVGAQTRAFLPITLREKPGIDSVPRLCIEEFATVGVPAVVTTDDGSCGMHGRTTDALAHLLQEVETQRTRVYACGPEPMLEAVARQCGERGVRCELAMERIMGCGMGTCQSCVIPIRDEQASQGWRYTLCCRDGPVFDAARVVWKP